MVCWFQEYAPLPRGIEACPFPVLLITQDYEACLMKLASSVRFVDMVGCFDQAAVGVFEAMGVPAIYTPSQGASALYLEPLDVARTYDLVFLGGMDRSHCCRPLRTRDQLLARLLRLRERYRLFVAKQAPGDTLPQGENYRRILSQARIVFTHTHSWKIHSAVCEAMACGALTFVNEDNPVLPGVFNDREHVVYYNERNLEDLVEYYVSHEEERAAIARRGSQRVWEVASEEQVLGTWLSSLHGRRNRAPTRRLILSDSPPRRLLHRAIIEFYSGLVGGAIQLLTELSAKPGPYGSQAYNNLAVCFLTLAIKAKDMRQRERYLRAAGDALDLAMAAGPHNVFPLYNRVIAQLHLHQVDPGEQIDHLAQALAQDPLPEEWLPDLCLAFYPELADGFLYNQAATLLRWEWGLAIADEPTQGPAYRVRLAHLLMNQLFRGYGNFLASVHLPERAITAYHRAVAALPTDLEAATELGMCYLACEDWHHARQWLEKAVRGRPLNMPARTALAQSLLMCQDWEALAEHCRESLLLNVLDEATAPDFHRWLAIAEARARRS